MCYNQHMMKMKWDVQPYEKQNGERPVEEYLDSIENEKHVAKIVRGIKLLEEYGPGLGGPYVDHLKDDIFELRIKFSSNIFRVLFFHFVDNKIILTHGFTKKTQKTPSREITRAEAYKDDFLKQKGGGRG